MTDLGPLLGGANSQAQAINSTGVIVGYSQVPGTPSYNHAFSYTAGSTTDLGTLGGNSSVANAINGAGVIVGYSDITGNASYHAFSYSSGTMTDLGTLGGAYSLANGVNSSGTIVGEAYTVGGVNNAFVDSDGLMTNLNSLVSLPGVTLSDATGINDLGDIVANGTNGQAYLLTPIPEPSTFAALIGGAAYGVATIRRRRAPRSAVTD